MDDQIEKNAPKIQADNQSIAIGEINISGTVTGNITIGHTIVQPAVALSSSKRLAEAIALSTGYCWSILQRWVIRNVVARRAFFARRSNLLAT
jgi:hypothetical protein